MNLSALDLNNFNPVKDKIDNFVDPFVEAIEKTLEKSKKYNKLKNLVSRLQKNLEGKVDKMKKGFLKQFIEKKEAYIQATATAVFLGMLSKNPTLAIGLAGVVYVGRKLVSKKYKEADKASTEKAVTEILSKTEDIHNQVYQKTALSQIQQDSIDFLVNETERKLLKNKKYKDLKKESNNLEIDYNYTKTSNDLNAFISLNFYPKCGKDKVKGTNKVDYVFAEHEPAIRYPKQANFEPETVLTTKPIELYGQKCKGVEVKETYIALQQRLIDSYIKANDHSNDDKARAETEKEKLLKVKEMYDQILEYKKKKHENSSELDKLTASSIERTFRGIIKNHHALACYIRRAANTDGLSSKCYKLTSKQQTQTVVKKVIDEQQF